MIIFPSLKCFTVFFSMELLIGYLKTYPLEGGQMGKSTYAMGGGSKRKCAHDGEEDRISAILMRMYQLNDP